jgi:hypothetical protein
VGIVVNLIAIEHLADAGGSRGPFMEQDGLSSHRYTQIKAHKHEIRLATVCPGPSQYLYGIGDHPQPNYEALSCVWGNSHLPTAMKVNGQRIHITKNLEEALRRLMFASTIRIICADAVCAKWNVNNERPHHVQQMLQIH